MSDVYAGNPLLAVFLPFVIAHTVDDRLLRGLSNFFCCCQTFQDARITGGSAVQVPPPQEIAMGTVVQVPSATKPPSLRYLEKRITMTHKCQHKPSLCFVST